MNARDRHIVAKPKSKAKAKKKKSAPKEPTTED